MLRHGGEVPCVRYLARGRLVLRLRGDRCCVWRMMTRVGLLMGGMDVVVVGFAVGLVGVSSLVE